MISFFRRLIGSKVGAGLALVFLALVAFAFAAGDINNLGGSFGGLGGGSATKIGDTSLTEQDITQRVQGVFEQQRRENPGLRIGDFLAMGAVPSIYDQLVAGLSLQQFAKDQGIHVSKRMVDAEIASVPAFQDASGKFSQNLFRQMLAGQGISEAALRKDIDQQLAGQLLIAPAGFGADLSSSMVLPYASLLLEARQGRIAAIPSAALVPSVPPSDAQLLDFYGRNADRYTIPEQRRLHYATLDAQRFAAAATPTESEIAKYYSDNRARYAASELRTVEQLILPTESIARETAKSPSLADAAKAQGLSVATLANKSRNGFMTETSADAAAAVFAASADKIVGPLRLPLGWAIFRTREIRRIPARSLDQARSEIVETLRGRKRQTLLNDFISKVEDDIAGGATFEEVVKDHGLQAETTPLLLQTGRSVEKQDYLASEDVRPLLKTAFGMEADDDAQFVPIVQNERYGLVDVADIVAPAPPPLEKVKAIVAQDYALHQGAAKARTIAVRLKAEIDRSQDKAGAFSKALAGAGVPLPPTQTVAGRRADLVRGDRRPPAEVSILFAMPQGAVKVMPIPGDRGYFLIMLDKIQTTDAAKVPGLADRVRTDMRRVVSNEYGQQFERAIERELGVEHNPALLSRVTQELRRINGAAAQ